MGKKTEQNQQKDLHGIKVSASAHLHNYRFNTLMSAKGHGKAIQNAFKTLKTQLRK